MSELTDEQKSHLDNCFAEFKKELYNRIKIPALGVIVGLGFIISIFATYIYLEAKMNVINAQAEFAAVKKDFYEDVTEAKKQIDEMVEVYNDLATNAEASVRRMESYEKTLESIATSFANMNDKIKKDLKESTTAPTTSDIPPPLERMDSGPAVQELFQLPITK